MAKKKPEGLFGALTMRQTDGLAVRLHRGANRLGQAGAIDAAMEVYDVTGDLHESWTERAEQGEYPALAPRRSR
jgi:hypothetical protein